MKKIIRTILEDIDPSKLGITDGHNHLFSIPPYWKEKGLEDLILDDYQKTKLDILLFKKAGGQAIVEATAIDYGRKIEWLAKLSQETKVKIVATAGLNKGLLWTGKIPSHLKQQLKFETYKQWIENWSIEKLANYFANEVFIGLEGTNFRAGQIKCGTGYNSISDLEKKQIKAVALAHQMSGAPIHCHTEHGTMGLEILNLFKTIGNVNFQQISIGHMDRNLDFNYHKKLLDQGVYLSFDGLLKIKYAPESARIEAIIKLVKAGYENQIMIGGDSARKSYYRNYGKFGLGLGYILAKWVPRFVEEAKAQNLDGEKLIEKFTIINPRKFLAFVPKK